MRSFFAVAIGLLGLVLIFALGELALDVGRIVGNRLRQYRADRAWRRAHRGTR